METQRQVTVLGSLGLRPSERMTGIGRCVVAHLALQGRRQMRSLVYSDLWPDVPEARARANLRRALWQLPRGWVRVEGPDLVLDAGVDLQERGGWRVVRSEMAS